MGPAVVQQPKHGKARRTAELIGADRVLPATPRSTKKMPVHAALLAELYLPEICPGSNPRLWSDAEQSGSNPPGWKKFAVPRCLRRASSGIRHSVDCISEMRERCRP